MWRFFANHSQFQLKVLLDTKTSMDDNFTAANWCPGGNGALQEDCPGVGQPDAAAGAVARPKVLHQTAKSWPARTRSDLQFHAVLEQSQGLVSHSFRWCDCSFFFASWTEINDPTYFVRNIHKKRSTAQQILFFGPFFKLFRRDVTNEKSGFAVEMQIRTELFFMKNQIHKKWIGLLIFLYAFWISFSFLRKNLSEQTAVALTWN